MSDYLCLTATLLMDRYHASNWPPSPARLLRALLAGRMTGGYRDAWDTLEPAFRWLEVQAPPEVIAVTAAEVEKRPVYRIAVPNNDLDVAATQWSKGKPYDHAKLKTMKTVSPLQLPGGPHVHYLWPVSETAPVEAIRNLAHSLHTLGWGVDMAYADAAILNESQAAQLTGERYLPAENGALWEVPIEGFLDNQLETYKRFTSRVSAKTVDPSVQPSVYGLQPYRKEDDTRRPWAAFTLQNPDDEDSFFSASWRDTMVVAAWLRHAAAEALREEKDWPQHRIAEYVQGHTQGDSSDRISYLPLPSVGMQYTDGKIRRVAIVEPIGKNTGLLSMLQNKLTGEVLTSLPQQKRECVLGPSPVRDKVASRYRATACVWKSVTPVILHGFNENRGRVSLRKTEKLLFQAFAQAGFPERLIRSITFQPAPLWAGTASSFQIQVPAQLNNYPRYHVRVEFHKPIGGPVLAGIGRHYGIGLFAAEFTAPKTQSEAVS